MNKNNPFVFECNDEREAEEIRSILENSGFVCTNSSVNKNSHIIVSRSENIALPETINDSERKNLNLITPSLLYTMPVMLIGEDDQGLIFFWNRECEITTGYRGDEVINNPHAKKLLFPDESNFIEVTSKMKSKDKAFRDMEVEILCRDGITKTISFSNVSDSYPFPVNSTWLVGMDITSRIKTEQTLKENEKRFKAVADYTFDWEIWIGPDGNFIWTNPAVERITGYTSADFKSIPNRINTVVFEEDRKDIMKHLENGLKKRVKGDDIEFRITRKDGLIRWLSASHQPIYSDDGEYLGVRISIRDISERKRFEMDLKESRERYRRIVESIPGVIYLYSTKRGGLYYTNKAEKLLGHKIEVLYKNPFLIKDSIHPEEKDMVNEAIDKFLMTKKMDVEYRIKNASGKWLWIHDRSIGMYIENSENDDDVIIEGIITDITERKKGEEQKQIWEQRLRQSQKMEAIGTLAGGIAHDFNNALGIILTNNEIALEDLSEDHPARFCLNLSIKAANRARELVKRILSFSRRTETVYRPIHMLPVISESLDMLRASLPANIEIKREFSVIKDIIRSEPTQLHQIIMNLITNAAQSISEKGGQIYIHLEEVYLMDTLQTFSGEIGPGPYIKFSVEDTGHGMAPDTIDRIFNPFFTTKKAGKGSGMGLTIIHGIIINHKGGIVVESTEEKGAKFEIYFPGIDDVAEPIMEENGHMPKGTERILFVDDEADLVKSVIPILERLGYSVTAFTESTKALSAFREKPDAFDLLISDQSMPLMTGMGLAKLVLEIRPNLSIIMCTGYSEALDKSTLKTLGVKTLLMKPVTRNQWAKVIRAILDDKQNQDEL